MDKNWKIETLAVQAGYEPGNGDPRVVPIAQSTTYKYDDIGEASVEEKQCAVPGSSKPYTYYVLHIALLKGGEIVIPVKNDAATDEILNVINRRVASKKTQEQA